MTLREKREGSRRSNSTLGAWPRLASSTTRVFGFLFCRRMGPPSGRRSTRDSRVTLYEPPAPPPPVAGSAPAGTSSRKRTRSSALTSDGDGDLALGLDDEKPLLTKTKKSPSPRKPTPFKVSLDRAHPPPKAWDQQYEIIRRQRERFFLPLESSSSPLHSVLITLPSRPASLLQWTPWVRPEMTR